MKKDCTNMESSWIWSISCVQKKIMFKYVVGLMLPSSTLPMGSVTPNPGVWVNGSGRLSLRYISVQGPLMYEVCLLSASSFLSWRSNTNPSLLKNDFTRFSVSASEQVWSINQLFSLSFLQSRFIGEYRSFCNLGLYEVFLTVSWDLLYAARLEPRGVY